jgi:hypothetical protein
LSLSESPDGSPADRGSPDALVATRRHQPSQPPPSGPLTCSGSCPWRRDLCPAGASPHRAGRCASPDDPDGAGLEAANRAPSAARRVRHGVHPGQRPDRHPGGAR